MLGKRLLKTNDAGGGVCQSDITDIFGDGSGVALYQLNWDASDMSGNYNGTATDVSFVNGYINEAGSFNGSSSRITTQNQVNKQAFSVSFWFKTTSTELYRALLGYGDNTDNNVFQINTQPNGQIAVALLNGGSYKFNSSHPTTNLNDGNWHNVVFSWDGTTNANSVKTYVDTVVSNTTSSISASSLNNWLAFAIGDYPNRGVYFNGQLDQVRIFNKALSSTEVTTLYNEVACEKTCTTNDNELVPDCIAYYKMDGNADDALNTYDGTPVGSPSYTQGRFGSSVSLTNLTTDAINISGFNASYFSNTNRSVSLWVNMSSLVSGFAAGSHAFTVSSGNWSLRVENNGIGFTKYLSSGSRGDAKYLFTPNLSQWYHIVATASTTNGMKLYVDGIERDTDPYTGAILIENNDVGFGYYTSPNRKGFSGSIDQVRIYDRAITAAEVTTLYNEVQCPSTASFNTVLYTGNGSTQNVGGVDFQPDMVWIKERSSSQQDHALFDSVRGIQRPLRPNSTNSEEDFTSTSNSLTSFNSDGFAVGDTTAGSYNVNGAVGGTYSNNAQYVAWCWKAGGAAVTNTDGSITSEVSANVDAGFSIVSYTGNGGTATVGHGLDAAPDMFIVKNRDGSANWAVYHSSVGVNHTLQLNTTSAQISVSGKYSGTNSSVFGVNSASDVNTNNQDYIAYCFAEKAGFSKFGSYVGNGSTSGPTITTGFEPAFVMIKASSVVSFDRGHWVMKDNKRDTTNPNSANLYANLSNAEDNASVADVNFLSNGFQPAGTYEGINESGKTYIYMAFADQF